MNDRTEVFAYVAGCGSMIKMTTGAVLNGIVNHDYIVIHNACPKVVREIVTTFKLVNLNENGLMIPLNPSN